MIREYVETDPKSALFALEWLVQDWKTESVAVLILKLFYKDRLSSPKFINRLDGITHSWDLIKIKELIPILLVGETVETAADFTLNLKRTASYDSAKLLEIVSTLVIAFSWNCTEMVEFLIAYCLRAVNDDRNKHTFVFLIRNEFNRIDQYNGGALVGLELFRVVFRVLLLDIPFDSASLIFDEVFNEIESW